MTIREAQQLGRSTLTNSPTAALDADCFLQFILSCDKTHLLMHCDDTLTQHQEDSFNKAIQLRTTGLPVAYITGHKEFYGIDFIVTPDVLIPKPDTEILVEQALSFLQDKSAGTHRTGAASEKSALSNSKHILTICDMCTGSGCIGLSLLHQCAEQKLFDSYEMPAITLADISDRALDIARKNLDHVAEQVTANTNISSVRFVRSNLFEAVPGTFDLITANPPYIPEQDALDLLKDGRHEPILALDGDIDNDGNTSFMHDGLTIMRSLVPQAYAHLAPGGALFVEAGEYNAEETESIFARCGFTNTKIIRDLAGQLRVIYGEKKESHSFSSL